MALFSTFSKFDISLIKSHSSPEFFVGLVRSDDSRSSKSSSMLKSLIPSNFSTDSSSISSNSDISFDEIKKIISIDRNSHSCLVDAAGILSTNSGPTRNTSINDFRHVLLKKGGTDAIVCIPSEKETVRKFQQGNGARELLVEGITQLKRSKYYTKEQMSKLDETSATCYRVGIDLPVSYEYDSSDSLEKIYDKALSYGLSPTVFQDLKKVSGEDGLPFILKAPVGILNNVSCILATLFCENLKLIYDNEKTQKGVPNGSELAKTFVKDSYFPSEKWNLSCEHLKNSILVTETVTIDPALYNLITDSIIDHPILINPVEEINQFFATNSWDCPVVGYWMNGDANISNILFDESNPSNTKITIIDGKPPKKADWLVDISKCIFSLLGGALIFNKELNLDSISEEKDKLTKLRQFKKKLAVEISENPLLSSIDSNWEQRATFFAISQFIRDCRPAFNNIERLEKEKTNRLVDFDSIGFVFDAIDEGPDLQLLDAEILAEQKRIQTNYTFAAALIHHFKTSK